MSNLATARPVPASEYHEGATGFYVECEHWRMGDDAPSYAIPAWEEMGMADLAGRFETEQAALDAIRLEQETWL